ncbi:MAG: TraR/DksA family transcriptional regulator [Deltaproteobacteria bacterium]|nr:TraR/DksA family transcriptional regulator [Deltaproteobacteria bacterium]
MPKTNPKNKKTVKPVQKKEKAPARKAAPSKKAKAASPKEEPQQVSKLSRASSARGKLPFKKEITQKLLESKNKILQEVTQKIKSESNVLKFEIGDIYDIASNERERELTLILGDRDREKLSEIEDALDRIKDNTYGGCEECGEPITENRLRALPFTRVCVECQSRNEREQKIKGRFEEESGLGILEKSDNEEEEF